MARIRPVTITGEAELLRNMRGYLAQVATKKEKQRILTAGAKVVRDASKLKLWKSAKKHWYYPRGRGWDKVLIHPGNLENSIYVFRHRGGVVSVGPRVLRPLVGKQWQIGMTPGTSSGYYAAMLYGSAAEFRKRVTDAALAMRLTQVNTAMERTLKRIHAYWKKKYNL